jgi:hypothetical protein
MSSQLDPHVCLSEPKLAFHPERHADRDIHPLLGLLRFGPYSSGMVPDPIRVATIAPANESQLLYGFMKELNSSTKATERADYLPDWPGFHSVFGLHMRAAGGAWIFRPREATVPEHGKPAFRTMGSQWRRLVEVVTGV